MNYINPFNQLSGIYRILNKINGNCYIGSSLNVEKRYKHHLSTLQNTTLSQETIKKMSEAKKGKPWSEKRRAAYLKKTYNEQIS